MKLSKPLRKWSYHSGQWSLKAIGQWNLLQDCSLLLPSKLSRQYAGTRAWVAGDGMGFCDDLGNVGTLAHWIPETTRKYPWKMLASCGDFSLLFPFFRGQTWPIFRGALAVFTLVPPRFFRPKSSIEESSAFRSDNGCVHTVGGSEILHLGCIKPMKKMGFQPPFPQLVFSPDVSHQQILHLENRQRFLTENSRPTCQKMRTQPLVNAMNSSSFL